MFSIEPMIERISEHAKMKPDRVRKLINEKQEELSGLVSEEGAAYIVARELGLNMIKESRKQLKVKNLVSGLRSVDLVARVVRIFDERQFERDGKAGSVINVLVGDETGVVRMSLWNEETAVIKEGGLKEGDTIRISGGWVKSDNRDMLELRVGRGTIQKSDQAIELPERDQLESRFETMKRSRISDFKEGGQYETRASLVQVFRRNPFYPVCPQCGAKARETDGKWACDEHGEVKPSHALVVSGIIDDGSGNIRAVFFRDNAERLFTKDSKELRAIAEKAADSMVVFDHVSRLGSDFILRGRVRKNQLSESLEFIVNSIDDMDPVREARELVRQLGG